MNAVAAMTVVVPATFNFLSREVDALNQLRSVSLLPLAILLVLGAIWGGVTNVAKFVGQTGMPALMYACMTTSLAATLLSIGSIVRRQPIPCTRRHIAFYVVSGVLGTGLPTSVVYVSVGHISVGIMSVVLAMVPVFTYLMAIGLRQEPFHALRACGIALGLSGAVLMLATQTGLAVSVPFVWVCFAFIAPVSYATANVFNHRYRPAHADSFALANGMMAGASVFLIVMVTLTQSWVNIVDYPASVGLLIVVHGALSALAFTLLFTLLRLAGPVYFSQVAYLVTLFGIAFGMVIFNERFDNWFWVSLVTTFTGILLVNRKVKSVVKGKRAYAESVQS